MRTRTAAAIFRRALLAPLRQIAENAGHDGGVVCAKLAEGNEAAIVDASG